MLVYRICKRDEVDALINNKPLYGDNDKNINFFREKYNIFCLDVSKDVFVCTYDIPDYLLKNRHDTWLYLDRVCYKSLEKADEYIIDNRFIKFEYLLKVERILEPIDIEEYIYEDISSKMELFYLKKDIANMLCKYNNSDKVLNLYSILMNPEVIRSIYSNLDFLIKLLPEIKFMIEFDHKHPHHHLDVWNHTLLALNMVKNDFDLRLSLLLHDIGKPFSEKDGIRNFYNHPEVSSEICMDLLTRLGFNDEYINKICYLIKLHDTQINENDINNDFDLTYTRYLMQECDAFSHNPSKLEKRKRYLDDTKKLILKKR